MPGSGRLSKDVRLQALDRVLEKTGGSHRLQAWDDSREGPNFFSGCRSCSCVFIYARRQAGRQAGQGKARQGRAQARAVRRAGPPPVRHRRAQAYGVCSTCSCACLCSFLRARRCRICLCLCPCPCQCHVHAGDGAGAGDAAPHRTAPRLASPRAARLRIADVASAVSRPAVR